MIWIKHQTDISSNINRLFVRGVQNILESNSSNGENTNQQSITSFDSDGFTYGTSRCNIASGNVCSWNWKAANAQGSSNI